MENKLSKSDLFKSIYYKTSNPGSFGGVERLLREVRKINSDIRRHDVKEWLKSQIVYTLHKPKINHFSRNPTLAEFPNENFQADCVFINDISEENDGIDRLLTVIDVFSKYAWCIPLATSDADGVIKAMEKIINERKPSKLMTDQGTEFKNAKFKKLMEKYDINHFYAVNQPNKCSVIERFNQTLKKRMQPFLTLTGKNRFIHELKNIMISYNNSFHKSIKMTPNEVTTDNSKIVFKNLYGVNSKREFLKKFSKPKIKVGSLVRIAYVKKLLDRGRYPNWTDQTYLVFKAMNGPNKPYYILKDSTGKLLNKRFYPEEVQLINQQPYRVEKILKQRKTKKGKQFLVKWTNYPESENSWIQASNLTKING